MFQLDVTAESREKVILKNSLEALNMSVLNSHRGNYYMQHKLKQVRKG